MFCFSKNKGRILKSWNHLIVKWQCSNFSLKMTVGKKSDSEVNSNIIILSKAASVKKKKICSVKLCHASNKTFTIEMIEDWMLISFHSLHIIYQIVYQDVSRVLLTLSLDFQMCLCCLSLSFIENDLSLYTLLFLQWITNKNLLYSTWNSAQCYVPAWMGGGFGGEWTHIHVWLSPFTVHLKLSQHC